MNESQRFLLRQVEAWQKAQSKNKYAEQRTARVPEFVKVQRRIEAQAHRVIATWQRGISLAVERHNRKIAKVAERLRHAIHFEDPKVAAAKVRKVIK